MSWQARKVNWVPDSPELTEKVSPKECGHLWLKQKGVHIYYDIVLLQGATEHRLSGAIVISDDDDDVLCGHHISEFNFIRQVES